MTKHHLLNGLTYYHCQAFELLFIGGLGICDSCNVAPEHGYLVPVLGWYLCPECFEDWRQRCINYPEDVWYEKRYMDIWERLIPCSSEEGPL